MAGVGLASAGIAALAWLVNGSEERAALKAGKAQKAIEPDRHALVHVKYEDYVGWHFLCACGLEGKEFETDPYDNRHASTESGTIREWERHRKNYKKVKYVAEETEADRLRKELADFKAKCYCKDIV